jgi:16S rRNA (adenine1518-N6/adenine1519-N6)-dimethyltransferase
MLGGSMDIPDYGSPRALKAFLEEHGLAMSKRFGQNFLVSPEARQRIVAAIGLEPGMRVWEIGPGIGSLTALLLESGVELTAFEIDHGFIEVLSVLFGGAKGFTIVPGDFLKTWKARLASGGMPDIVCGNLPYNSANAFMGDFATAAFFPARMVFTVQREGADRMRAPVDSKSYSSFSVLCQSFYGIKRAFDLPPPCFWPEPRVSSSVIVVTPRQDPPRPADRALYLELVRSLFTSRRKTVFNNLRTSGRPVELVREALESAGIDPQVRAETLSPHDIARLSDALSLTGKAPS